MQACCSLRLPASGRPLATARPQARAVGPFLPAARKQGGMVRQNAGLLLCAGFACLWQGVTGIAWGDRDPATDGVSITAGFAGPASGGSAPARPVQLGALAFALRSQPGCSVIGGGWQVSRGQVPRLHRAVGVGSLHATPPGLRWRGFCWVGWAGAPNPGTTTLRGAAATCNTPRESLVDAGCCQRSWAQLRQTP